MVVIFKGSEGLRLLSRITYYDPMQLGKNSGVSGFFCVRLYSYLATYCEWLQKRQAYLLLLLLLRPDKSIPSHGIQRSNPCTATR